MAAKNVACISIIFLPVLAIQGAVAKYSKPAPRIADYSRPVSFEPNRGKANQQVDFLARGTGYSLFLSRGDAVMVLRRGDGTGHSATVRMRPAGGNALAPVDALSELPGKSNYFIGSDPEHWHTGIPTYAQVRYRDVYPGIDLLYYGNQRQLEYDFVVSPGADPRNVSVELEGSGELDFHSNGNLVMHTAAGDLTWHKPFAYQSIEGRRMPIQCAFVQRSGQRLGFALAEYDRSKPLIIDPTLQYTTVLTYSATLGEGPLGNAIAVDDEGNAYVTGMAGYDFPTTKDAFQSSQLNPISNTAFVLKFNSKGELIYSTYLGGSGFDSCAPNRCYKGDRGNGIAIDRHGNAYITGYTTSEDFPVKNAFQNTNKAEGGLTNGFVTKLDSSGSALIYSTYLGGHNDQPGVSIGDAGYAIAVDEQGNAYVTGTTVSTDFPTKHPFQDQLNQFGQAGFVTKLSPAGNALIYSTYLRGSVAEFAGGIAVDTHGNAYVTGSTVSPDFPVKNAFQTELKGGFGNAFVTKFAPDGESLVYSTFLGGSGNGLSNGDGGAAIAVDRYGNAYITGSTASHDFPTKNAFQPASKASGLDGTSAFVTKLSPTGNSLVYSTYLGGTTGPFGTGDFGTAIAVDRDGNAYVTGQATSSDFPVKNAFEPVMDLGSGDTSPNGFVTMFDAAGSALVYSSYLGGISGGDGDQGNGIGVDALGNAYVAGSSSSSVFPITESFGETEGNSGVFVSKVSVQWVGVPQF